MRSKKVTAKQKDKQERKENFIKSIIGIIVVLMFLIIVNVATKDMEPKTDNNEVKVQASAKQTRKENGYTKKDLGNAKPILDKKGRVFYKNSSTDQYFTYLDEARGYWLADETYVARNWGDTFVFGNNVLYRYKDNYYKQVGDSIVKISSEEFYKINYSNAPWTNTNYHEYPSGTPKSDNYSIITPIGENIVAINPKAYTTAKGNVIIPTEG